MNYLLKTLLVTLSLILTLGCGQFTDQKTDHEIKTGYPSNYPVNTVKKNVGPFAVSRFKQLDEGLGFLVNYSGKLVSEDKAPLYLYIKIIELDEFDHELNQLDIVTARGMQQSQSNDKYLKSIQIYGGRADFRLSNKCLIGKFEGCAESATPEMARLVDVAVDKSVRFLSLNRIRLELAVTNDEGQWDTRGGQSGANYVVEFDSYLKSQNR